MPVYHLPTTKTTNFNEYLGKKFMPREKTGQAQVKVLVDRFVRMLPGQSFFIPDVTRKDVEFLRRPVLRIGCGIKILEVEQDEIYQAPGVRIWREEGPYDEL
jgi:hypothetical protein